MDITYSEYLEALQIVNSYHEQILTNHNKIENINDKEDENNKLIPFLESNDFSNRTLNSIRIFIQTYLIENIDIETDDISVSFFIQQLSKHSRYRNSSTTRKKFDIVRNLSISEFQRILVFIYENGYSKTIKTHLPELDLYAKL